MQIEVFRFLQKFSMFHNTCKTKLVIQENEFLPVYPTHTVYVKSIVQLNGIFTFGYN